MKLTPWLRSLKSGIARALSRTKVKRREQTSGMKLISPAGGAEALEDRTLLAVTLYRTNHQDGVYDAGNLLQPQPSAPIPLGLDPRGVPAIPIIVNFDLPVTIGSGIGVGSPWAFLTFNTSSNDPTAPNYPGVTGFAYYLEGAQTNVTQLTFWYEVRNGENTPGPLQPDNGTLHVTGGGLFSSTTLTDSSGPVSLAALPAFGPSANGVIVDATFTNQPKNIFIDTKPIVLDINSTTPDSVPYNNDPSQGPVRRPYRVGDEPIHIQVYFSEPVAITGAPELVLQTNGIFGAQDTDGRAVYLSGSGTSTLSFDYVINPGDNTFDLDTAASNALQLPNGASIRDQDFVQDTGILTVSAPSQGGLVPGILGAHRTIQVDTLTPLIGPRPDEPVGSPFTGVTSLNANGTYGAGQTLTLRISFNETILLTGTPTLVLATGPVNREATFAGFDGTDTLLFTYTVQPGDLSSDLDYVGPNALRLNGGSLTDLAGNIADITLPAPGQVGSLSFNKDIVIDTVVAVTNVTTTVPSGSYGIGQVIPVQVIFNKPVTVFGTPQLILDLDDPTDSVVVNYSGGSGTNILTFNYTIQAGHNTIDLDYISAAALQLNGGAIVDTIGNGNAVLTLPLPGAQGSLGFNKNILIDTNIPSITGVSAGASVPDGTYVAGQTIPITVTFNEAVSVTGVPTLTLDTNGLPGIQAFLNPGDTADAVITYTSGSGTNTLTFNYTVQQGQNSLDLDALFLTLANNSQIRDLAGNEIAPTGSILTLPQFPNEALTNARTVANVAPVSQIVDLFVGNVTPGATYQFTVGSETFSYVANASDTQGTIAANLRQDVNARGGSVVSATGFSNNIRLTAKVAGNAYTVTIPVGSALTQSLVRPNTAAVAQVDTITVNSVATDTEYRFGVNGVAFSYTANFSDTPSTVALGIRDIINNHGTVGNQVTASVSGSVVTIVSDTAGTPFTLTTGGSLAGNRNIAIDTAPVVTLVRDVVDADGVYVAGQTLSIDVRFTEPVTVSGTPLLVLETNGIAGIQDSDARAVYTSGSGTNTLRFLYTIVAGETSVDLNYASVTALLLNGGSIQDLDGTPANLDPTLPSLTGSGSLAANNELQIDDVTVNDPPVNFIPGLQTIPEDIAGGLVFSTANGNAIRIKDADAGSSDVQVTFDAAFGTVNLPTVAGLTSVTGNGTNQLVIVGSLSVINSLLDGLTFTPDLNVNSQTTSGIQLTITTDDLGNTGPGGARTDVDVILFNVTPVNDAPVAADQTVQTAFGTPVTITLQASDVDLGSLSYSLDLTTPPLNGTLTHTPGSNTVIYTPNANFVGVDTFRFTASDGTLLSNQGVVTVNVLPTVAVNGFPDITVNEGNAGATNATFTITLSHPAPLPITIDFSTIPGTATENVDYQFTSSSVSFAVGQQTATFTVPIIGDLVDEPGETFNVQLANPVNVVLVDTVATATIQNDDGLSINDATVTEGDNGTKIFTFTVSLSSPSGSTVSVNYQTVDGSASQNSDYNNQSGQLTFIPGETSKTISITVNGDTINEQDEVFYVDLLSPIGASLGKSRGLGTILNDDATPTVSINDIAVTEGNNATKIVTFLVTLSSISGQTVTVNYNTVNGTAIAGDDYFAASGTVTFVPGTTSQQVTVTLIGDQIVEPDDTFQLQLTNPVNAAIVDGLGIGTILNDDGVSITDAQVVEGNAGTKNLVFTVTAPIVNGQTVSVDYLTSPGSATPGVDYTPVSGTLVFTGGVTSRTITVPIIGDFLEEGDETFFISLSNATNAPLLVAEATGTILDDDVTPSISASDVTVVEGDAGTRNAVFTLTLSQAIGAQVTVDYSTFDVTAVAGLDYVPVSGTAVFQPFQTTITVIVPILGDTIDEANSETFRLHLANAVNATLLTNDAIGTILDDDATPSLSINDLTINEGQAGLTQVTFTVSLSAASGQTVTVNYQTADGSALSTLIDGNNSSNDYAAQSGTLTFLPGVTTQTVTITVNADALNELDETFYVDLAGATNAGISKNRAIGTISNDDPLPTIVVGDATVFEGNSGTAQMVFTVNLLQPSALPVTVSYSTASGTATNGVDYQTAASTLTFAPGETSKTITVTVFSDLDIEDDETLNLNLSTPVNAVIGDPLGVGTIRNDDMLPSIIVSDATIVEGNSGQSMMVFTVTRLNPTSQITTVKYATSNGTATAGQDYTAVNGTLTFQSGETTKTVSVPILGDAIAEPDETLFLNLSDVTNGTIDDLVGAGTIVNDDNAPPSVTVPLGSLTVAEEASLSILGISVADPDAGSNTISVTLSVQNGTIVVRNDVVGGLNGGQIQNNGTSTVQLTGSIAAINATLASLNGVVYQGFTDFYGVETLMVTANDLGNTGSSPVALQDTKAVTINVTNVNDAPELEFTGPGNSEPVAVTSTRGNDVAAFGSPNSLTLNDSDNPTFSGGTITVSNLGPFVGPKDSLSIRNQGKGAGLIGFKRGKITFGGVQIGTASGGSRGSVLVITLNGNASEAAVSALMKNITFGTAKARLATLPRTISMVMTDGKGGTSNTIQTVVNVTR